MDIIQILSGRFLLNFIGGTLRYVFGTIWRSVFGKTKFRFKEYINGPKESNHYDDFGHQFNNQIIGAVFLGIIVVMLINYYP